MSAPPKTHSFASPIGRMDMDVKGFRALVFSFYLSLLGLPALAQPVQCHITFAGFTRTFSIEPATSMTDGVTPLLEGASFSLEVINRLPPAPGAGVTVRTYGVFSGEPYLMHQAFYLPQAPVTGPHGFTGLQVVREPLRHHEIAYWCERPTR